MEVIGKPFIINSTKTDFQANIAGLTFGSKTVELFLSSQTGTDYASYRIMARFFDASGEPIGRDFAITKTFQASVPPIPNQVLPIIDLGHGKFAIEHTSSAYQLTLDTFSIHGTQISKLSSVTVAQDPYNYWIINHFGDLATNGKVTVSVSEDGPNSLGDDIHVNLFSADGKKHRDEFTLNITRAGQQTDPSIAALRNDNFLVAWEDGADRIRYRLLNDKGQALGGEKIISGKDLYGQVHAPEVTALTNGGYVITYQEYDQSLFSRVFDAHGKQIAKLMIHNLTTELFPSDDFAVTATKWGGFVVAFDDPVGMRDDNENAYALNRVIASEFTSYGRQIDNDVIVHARTDEAHNDISLTMNSRGNAMLAWTESSFNYGDKSGTAVKSVVIDVDDKPIEGSSASTTITGRAIRDVIFGNGGNDFIKGGSGNDSLYGDAGHDTLSGGAGNDRLEGGAGRDVLTGGAGADIFKFAKAAHSSQSASDVITDFSRSQGDKINLQDIDVSPEGRADYFEFFDHFNFIGDAEFSGYDSYGNRGDLRFERTSEGVILLGDVDGDRTADFVLEILHIDSLVADDFILRLGIDR